MPFGAVVIVYEVIADRGHELIARDNLNELGVLCCFVQQILRLRLHHYHRERERREGVCDIRAERRTDEIGEGA